MKKLLMTTLIVALLVVPLGSVALATDLETSEENLELVEFVPGAVPASMTPTESVNPAVHAVLLAMLNHNAAELEGADSLVVWESLYNMLSLYGQMDDRSEYQDELLILPSETVMDYAASLFPGFDITSPIPEELSDRLSYDAQSDCFQIVCGNSDLAETRFSTAIGDDGLLYLDGSLIYLVDDSELAQFQAVLVPQDNLFGYLVADVNVA